MVWLFVCGSVVGSFLNVCIYRLPRDLSIVAPRSRCPACGMAIRWYDNVPVLGHLMLGGKCRFCLHAISPRYMLVELLTGALFVALYFRFCVVLGRPLSVCGVYALLTASLIASTFIDFEFRIIPNEITFTGIALGPVLCFLVPELHVRPAGALPDPGVAIARLLDHAWLPERVRAVLLSLLGIVVAGGVVYALGLLGKLMFRKDALGFGDVKLMALVGGVTGWEVAVVAFFIAPFFGLLMGIPSLLLKGKHVIPYGPFLSTATLVVLAWRPQFMALATGRLWH